MQTLGESRVSTTFNPAASDIVTQIKNKTAELIDLINQIPHAEGMDIPTQGEWLRLKSLGMTSAEESAMWAVKAATI